jgi:hypothetical protein
MSTSNGPTGVDVGHGEAAVNTHAAAIHSPGTPCINVKSITAGRFDHNPFCLPGLELPLLENNEVVTGATTDSLRKENKAHRIAKQLLQHRSLDYW